MMVQDLDASQSHVKAPPMGLIIGFKGLLKMFIN